MRRMLVVAVAVAVALLAVAVAIPFGWWAFRAPDRVGAPVTSDAPSGPAEQPSAPAGSFASGAPAIGVHPGVAPPVVQVSPPIRLRVPGVRIDLAVVATGVGPDGAMALPSTVTRGAWYRFGPAPGDPAGSVVIAGHVDQRAEGLGQFARLRQAKVGDTVQVTTADGRTWRYRVTGRDLIAKRALPLDDLFRRDGPPRLVLITCGGPYLRSAGGYQDNVVVVAAPQA